MVPLLDVNAQNLPLEAELSAAFHRVLQSGQFILGPDVSQFEAETAAFLGAPHAIGVSSGTDALLLALMALEIGPGDEVLCPAFSFFATAGCIARVGATPVFVDVDPVSFNIDVEHAAARITARTKAVIPVHLFGQCADLDPLLELAARHGLRVVEDAAQAFGATYGDQSAGVIGDLGAYSFFPSKNLGGLGDGGLLVCRDGALAEKIRVLRNHGASPKYYHRLIGGNFRLDTLQAAFLRVKLPRLDDYARARAAHAAVYHERLAPLTASAHSGPPAMILPRAQPDRRHVWNQFTVRFPAPGCRDRVREFLLARGVGSEIYYPVPLHRQECFRGDTPAADCPVSEQLAREVLSIPIYGEMNPAQQEEVIAALAEALRS